MLLVMLLMCVPSVSSYTVKVQVRYGVNDDLPDYFSWRDINGTDYTTSVKDQSPAPSCEAYALVLLWRQ